MIKEIALRIPQVRRLRDSRDELKNALDSMGKRARDLEDELRALRSLRPPAESPFYAYFSNFDAIEMIRRHEVHGLHPTPGFQTNWLGVLVDPKIHPFLATSGNQLEPVPLPANWHADIAEWAAVLQSVENAPRDSFTMIELGCGWGCWMNNAGVAARRTGRKVHVVGVEGDAGHIQFAQEALMRNGFRSDEFTIYRGIAAAACGTALFPRQEHAGHSWGLEPVFGATQAEQDEAAAFGSHDILPMIALADAIGEHSRVDLVHIDIQGGEADLVEQCMSLIDQKVAYLVIGTHSKKIEARLFDLLGEAGWRIEMERPAFYDVKSTRPILYVDGLQGWRNPLLMNP
ncbi:class I SAM-dependent methyltransferase [Variovorax sp. J22P240]|uniref:class I SAM-dependent methyltransferase n=1 Tax=Variovorax sp. J22P240 TaxID=3053514 RepID=UPI002576CC21|nr:class I SAM-dependent methyltransferase [Variovorax sp. J22P240]MDL9999596.1 class I SAM-dependent methyltransferase [Variovorax sp. J22P240]